MLTLLKIKNVALIGELAIEFGEGLNLLTGETGSGKSIIVDSLGALTGDRVSNDLIKEGEQSASIEGLFSVLSADELRSVLDENGIDIEGDPDLIVRRELSLSGKNRIFINGQLATQGLLKRIGSFLVDIHGQGEQAALYDPETHIALLDQFADISAEKENAAKAFRAWADIRRERDLLQKDDAEKLQTLDILRFQTAEIKAANLEPGQDASLEEEKRRLSNIERLTALSDEIFGHLYDNADSTSSTLEKARKKVDELALYESKFAGYSDGLSNAKAVIEDLSFAVRDFRSHLEYSPERLNEIEARLAEILRLKRKYGDSIESILEHLRVSDERIQNIETSEFRKAELDNALARALHDYVAAARDLNARRVSAARKFEKKIVQDLQAVAMDKARFEIRIERDETDEATFSKDGFDAVEFYFSANPGESPKPLAKVASGGEASRLMLVLKTIAKGDTPGKTAVFDEIDTGIGGRVAEAVGRKLKDLSLAQQVLCVTHQPQIASLADHHFVVVKTVNGKRMTVGVADLTTEMRVEEIARMLAGSEVTDAARENARAMIAAVR